MTNTDGTHLTELADAVAPVRERHPALLEAARSWQAGSAQQTDPGLFALICAAADASPDVTPTRWTRTGTYVLVRCGIANWCSRNRCLWPDGTVEALWAWFDFLHRTGRMDAASDPIAELRKPLACYGGLDQNGATLPDGAEREIECECMLPYRETAELLSELVRIAECEGQDPLDPLRRLVGRPEVRPREAAWSDPDDRWSWSASGP